VSKSNLERARQGYAFSHRDVEAVFGFLSPEIVCYRDRLSQSNRSFTAMRASRAWWQGTSSRSSERR
jgi:hypothetical protein